MTTDVALPSDYETGLEDFDPSEASLPRVQIVHKDGLFVDKQTNEQFPKIYGVFLGLIKQRAMWAKELEDDSKPLCKSNDAEWGYPNVTGPSHSLFPWAASTLDPNQQPRDEEGRITIKCETCPMAQWGRSSTKSTPPPCSERYTMPIHYSTTPGGQLDRAGIVSFHRSGITPLKAFISAFSRMRQPLFSAYMELGLSLQKRGQVDYSVPTVKRGAAVPPENWEDFAREYRSIREFLRQRPRMTDGATPVAAAQPASNAWGGQAVQAQATVQPAAAPPDPWESTQPAAPAQTWPATAAPVQPTQNLMGGNLIDAASTPVQQAPPAQPVQAPVAAPAQVAPVYVADDDDLPF
jgi:hypothetical protein